MTTDQPKTTDDLLPCPFCGSGPAVSIQNASFSGVELIYWHGSCLVICGTCGTEGPKHESQTEAITAWNRRAIPAAQGQEGEAPLSEGVTSRGFEKVNFRDYYGVECSIQKSSLATEDAIWIGADALGLKRFPGNYTGWHDVDLGEVFPGQDISANTRMHLTQDGVRTILPTLVHFAQTGEVVALPAATAPASADLDALVARLRSFDVSYKMPTCSEAAIAITDLCLQQADLRAENERLRQEIRNVQRVREHEYQRAEKALSERDAIAAAAYEAAACVASDHSIYSKEAIQKASVQALIANLGSVARSKAAHEVAEAIRALTPSDARAALDRLIADRVAEAKSADGWQGIESAPKGRDVLLSGPNGVRIDDWALYSRHNGPRFTHWMPLPAMPAALAADGEA